MNQKVAKAAIIARMTALLLMLFGFLQATAQNPAAPVAGSAVCQSCHSDVYTRWSDSIHGRMIQLANRKSVVSRTDEPGGPASAKEWRDDVLYIVENGVENRVDYTLGNR